jgi:protein-tyrosine phosphatase
VLRVPDELVMEDYLLTNAQLLPAEKPVFDRFRDLGGDPELLRPVIGVEREYLEAALDEMGKEFGAIDNYFAGGLGVDVSTQSALRSTFVESG